MSAEPIAVTADSDDELKSALLAAFGDEAMCLLDDDDQTLIPGLMVTDQDSPKLRWVKELTHAIYADQLTDLGIPSPTSTNTPNTTTRQSRCIVFMVGEHRLAVPLEEVREIVHGAKVTRLPRTPAWLRGVINLRGKILSVIDLSVLLKTQTECASTEKKLMILHDDSQMLSVAIVVDHIVGLRKLENEKKQIDDWPSHCGLLANQKTEIDDQETFLISTKRMLDNTELHDE